MLFASPFVSYLPAFSPTLLPTRQDSRSLINLIHFIFYGSFFEVVRATFFTGAYPAVPCVLH